MSLKGKEVSIKIFVVFLSLFFLRSFRQIVSTFRTSFSPSNRGWEEWGWGGVNGEVCRRSPSLRWRVRVPCICIGIRSNKMSRLNWFYLSTSCCLHSFEENSTFYIPSSLGQSSNTCFIYAIKFSYLNLDIINVFISPCRNTYTTTYIIYLNFHKNTKLNVPHKHVYNS